MKAGLGERSLERRSKKMTSRFDRYYERQMGNPKVRAGVEKELASLEVGIQIARAREALHLNETQLAARAGMNASKISRIENSSQNLTLNTLKRIAECARPESEHRVDPKGKQKGEGRDCGLHTNARAKAGRLKGQEIYIEVVAVSTARLSQKDPRVTPLRSARRPQHSLGFLRTPRAG
jgi:transcriptional regulator with XRE-family HTH domain